MRADTTKETTIGTCPVCKELIVATVRYIVETEPPALGNQAANVGADALTINVTAKPIGLTMRHTCNTDGAAEGSES